MKIFNVVLQEHKNTDKILVYIKCILFQKHTTHIPYILLKVVKTDPDGKRKQANRLDLVATSTGIERY